MKKSTGVILYFILCYCYSLGQAVSTFAGTGAIGAVNAMGTAASFYYPANICRDQAGDFYVADQYNHLIRKITPAGVVTTFAGSGTPGSSNGIGTSASFNRPFALCSDALGNIYVTDFGNAKIRKITSAGVVTTLAGSGSVGSADGTGSAASFNGPDGICVDALGNIYVSDFFNNKIRCVTQAGVVTTFAGSGVAGSANGTGTGATFSGPVGICIDPSGDFFVSDFFTCKIRKITSVAVVTTFAGSGSGGAVDATGLSASFNGPAGICSDATGNIYVADQNNHKIRKITPGAVVTTIAGSGVIGYSDGPASLASFNTPESVCVDNAGSVFVAELYNHTIRRIGSCSAPVSPTGLNNNLQMCFSKPVTLSAASTGTINWFNISTGGTALSSGASHVISNTLSAGAYTYYAEAYTCTQSTMRTPFIFTVNALPNVTINTGSVCSGQPLSLFSAGALTYSYLPVGPLVSPTISTTYTVTGTNAAGCTNSAAATVTVQALPTIAVNSGSVCFGQSFTIIASGVSNYTYSSVSPIVMPLATSFYTVSGVGTAGCIGSAVSTVTVKPLPAIVASSGTICSGQSFTIVPSGGVSYTYSSGSSLVSPATTTFYTVSGTDAVGCSNSTISDVTVHPLPAISTNSGTICAGTFFTITPTGAINYTYSTIIPLIAPIVNTTYSVIGVSALGCTNSVSQLVKVNPLPIISVVSSQSAVCIGNTATLVAGNASTYSWSTGNSGNTIHVVPTVLTMYTVIGTDANGCVNSKKFTQFVEICTGIIEEDKKDKNVLVSIYPNPNNGEFYIYFPEDPDEKQIRIYNILGQIVIDETLKDHKTMIDMIRSDKGIYIIRIFEKDQLIFSSRIVKE